MTSIETRVQKRPNVVPGPKGLPLIGNLDIVLGKRDIHSILHLREIYGDIIRQGLGTAEIYILTHPDLAARVLQINNRNYVKGDLFEQLRDIIGNGLVTSEGEFWRRQRRLIQPAFHRRLIAGFADIMIDETDAMLQRWSEYSVTGKRFRLDEHMARLTLRIVARSLFSTSLSEADITTIRETLVPLLQESNRRRRLPFDLLKSLPTPANRAFEHNLARLNGLIHGIIENRRLHPGDYQDLLQTLIDMTDEDSGQGMSNAQLRDEVVTLFIAGHETTAIALLWMFKLLSEQPIARRELQREVETVLGERRPTADDYSNLLYTLAVFEETARLYPPVTMIPRTLLDDDVLGGYTIPKGAHVVVNLYALHHHPDFWDNPEGFDPARFLTENAKGRHPFAYIPFGRGPRLCIGELFAKMEAALVLARITQKFEVNLAPGQNIRVGSTPAMRPETGIFVTVKPRA
ncbi:MAG: cytochrome P450 [Chloroflexales bacterium]|nr:cytochrome P450 [Chloroflexales bacterium]